VNVVKKKFDKKGPEVEVMPGITVRQELIDEAVKATSDPAKATLAEEARERAKTQKVIHDHELREDIEVSKQITQAILDQVGKPEPVQVNINSLPPELKRVVNAFLNLRVAQGEYADALSALAKSTQQPTVPFAQLAGLSRACLVDDLGRDEAA